MAVLSIHHLMPRIFAINILTANKIGNAAETHEAQWPKGMRSKSEVAELGSRSRISARNPRSRLALLRFYHAPSLIGIYEMPTSKHCLLPVGWNGGAASKISGLYDLR